MTKDVLVSVRGLQMSEVNNEDSLETISPASYYKKNGHHYLVYDEVAEGFDKTTHNIMKFNEDLLDLTKKGLINVHMIFEEEKSNLTSYHTPFGDVMIGIDTDSIQLTEEDDHIQLLVDYALEANYQHLADCKITVDIKPREAFFEQENP